MKNPIINELEKLNLINRFNIVILNERTRDKNIKVLKDLKTNIIFLEKCVTNNKYYSSIKYKDYGKKIEKKSTTKFTNISTFSGNIKTPIIEDDYRRAIQFKKIIKKKTFLILDVDGEGF